MRTIKKLVLAGLACLTVTAVHAATAKLVGPVDSEAGLTYSKNVPINMNTYGVDQLAVQVNYSTVSAPALAFTDGSESTGTITVTSNTGISTTTATAYLVVRSTNVPGACITYFNGSSGQTTCNPGSWRVDVTSDTAADIATQMSTQFSAILSTSNTQSNVYSTATLAGSAGNSMTFATNTSSITVNGNTSQTGSFSGGQDGATLWIGNTQYKFGVNVGIGAAASNTATNLAAAIAASSATTNITAASAGAIVSATSTVVGTQMNVTIYSSTQAALTIGGSTVTVAGLNGAGQGQMWGGTNSAYTIALYPGTTNQYMVVYITTTTNPAYFWPAGLTPMIALPVLYSTGSATAIMGLTNQTTYYLIPVTPSSYGLSTTSTGALAGYNALPVISTTNGTFIILSSSQSKVSADSFSLTPPAYTGTTTLTWYVSNDCINYTTYPSTGLVTLTPTASIQTYGYDFGTINYKCVQANLVRSVSTTAGETLSIIANGKNSGL